MKQYLLPKKIVAASGLTNGEALYQNHGLYGLYESNAELWGAYTKIEGLGSSITLDFGKEMNGGIRVTTGWIYYGTCRVRVRFGESLGEVNADIGEKNATNVHGPRDFETTFCAISDVTMGQTGFRFVRIDLLEEKYIYLRNIFCVNEMLIKKPIYTYQGGDERIAAIFETAKRTVDLCAASGYVWDGIKRDRLVWMGDLATEVMALTSIYGQIPAVERSLDFVKKTSPMPRFMNGISTYSMWWIIVLADYYKEFACQAYIKKHKTYLLALLKRLDELVDADGNISDGGRALVDWPTKDTVDESVGNRAIFVMAMNGAIELLGAMGWDSQGAQETKRRLLLQPMKPQVKKQVVALKYFATGELTDDEYAMLIEGGAKGFSTFMSYYILSAIASRDEALAIALMKEYYGAMLDRGATTFWEDFDMEWLEGSGKIDEICEGKKDIHGDYGAHCYVGYRHSLCHGWSSGVVKFIKEHT